MQQREHRWNTIASTINIPERRRAVRTEQKQRFKNVKGALTTGKGVLFYIASPFIPSSN